MRVSMWVLPAIIVGVLLAWLRFTLIEPAPMRALCESAIDTSPCWLRQAVIELFIHQRIGWAALIAAGLALVTVNAWIAGVGLVLATAALILYVPEPGAVALLVCLLVVVHCLARDRQLNAVPPASNAKPIA